MIRLSVQGGDGPVQPPSPRRQRFGLEAPLPTDRQVVQRAVLRYPAESCPEVLVLVLERPGPENSASNPPRVDLAQGAPDLLLVRPGGALVFLAIRVQAHRPSRAERAFADLCRTQAVPFHVVRSLAEMRRVLDLSALPQPAKADHGKKNGVARRWP